MSQDVQPPKMQSLFRIQTLLLLHEAPKSGYDLAKELQSLTGKRPSSGKLYPFLHELRDSGHIEEIDGEDQSGRTKSSYILTKKGQELKVEMLDKMSNLLDIRLTQMLDKCHHCLVQLYDSKVDGKDKDGNTVVFCCPHCMAAFNK